MLIPVTGFFLIAMLYSAAGFGGGSSYLALLVLVGWKAKSFAMVALACNMVVTGQGTWFLVRNGYLKWKNILPFVAASIPMALLGGLYKIRTELWFVILGTSLILSGFALLVPKKNEGVEMDKISPKFLWVLGISLGSGLGFLAGLVGIGGGIFLSPILHFFKIGKSREIAAMATAFILLNSASGLLGQVLKSGLPDGYRAGLALIAAVILGGNIGSRWATHILSNNAIKYWTAVLVITAGVRILW